MRHTQLSRNKPYVTCLQVVELMVNKYAGMTVNERLYVSGLMGDFDKAVEKKDAEKVRSILEKVELTEESIMPIIGSLGVKE